MPVERKDPDRVRLMDAYLKEVQAFAIKFRLGIISRDEWREWIRQEYNVPVAAAVLIEGGVPDMSDIAGLPEFVASLVDGRMTELFTADEGGDGRDERIVEAEMGPGGAQGEEEVEELTDEVLERLAQEGE